jgi:hypothetical protein
MTDQAPKTWRHKTFEDFTEIVEFLNKYDLKPEEVITAYHVDWKQYDLAYYHHKELE